MDDYWVILYDADTGAVWAEMVRGSWLEAIIFATWLKNAAGGEPRYHAAVVRGWEEIPPIAEVLSGATGMGLEVFTRSSSPPPQTGWTVSTSSLVPTGEPLLGDEFVREWMEMFGRVKPQMEALRARIVACGLTDTSPELHTMMVKCIREGMAAFELGGAVVEPEPALRNMLDCMDQELTAHGCEPAEKPLNPWMIGGLVAGSVVLVGGGIYLATRD